jgi:hypothetical protein
MKRHWWLKAMVATGALGLTASLSLDWRLRHQRVSVPHPEPEALRPSASAVPSAAPVEPEPGCAATTRCEEFGECGLRDGECEPTLDAHCAASSGCAERGACALVERHCGPRSDAHCAASGDCRRVGNCGVSDGHCLPTGDEHCSRSEGCQRDGMCRRLTGDGEPSCGAKQHADCAQTELCRSQGRCRLAPLDFGGGGRCLAIQLEDRQSVLLTQERHGIDGKLVLALDPRFPKRRDPQDLGYWPDEDALRSAAALQLRDASGAVRDELTLYPDVSLRTEALGSGTDSFLLTEYLSCPAGHWCGWNTVFAEVRGGHLSRLRALGPKGEESDMVFSASGGARWKLERKAGRSVELVEQVEGPAPVVPALIERRFYFENGRFHFTEKQWADFDPKVARQGGRWFGALEFHGTQ